MWHFGALVSFFFFSFSFSFLRVCLGFGSVHRGWDTVGLSFPKGAQLNVSVLRSWTLSFLSFFL
jgi:hypothetical protein